MVAGRDISEKFTTHCYELWTKDALISVPRALIYRTQNQFPLVTYLLWRSRKHSSLHFILHGFLLPKRFLSNWWFCCKPVQRNDALYQLRLPRFTTEYLKVSFLSSALCKSINYLCSRCWPASCLHAKRGSKWVHEGTSSHSGWLPN